MYSFGILFFVEHAALDDRLKTSSAGHNTAGAHKAVFRCVNDLLFRYERTVGVKLFLTPSARGSPDDYGLPFVTFSSIHEITNAFVFVNFAGLYVKADEVIECLWQIYRKRFVFAVTV